MAVKRGSQHRAVGILEASYGVTPATPAMKELLLTRLRPGKGIGAIRSGQIRTHPFTDKMMRGRGTQDLEFGGELQHANYDDFLQMLAGQAWASNVLKIGDGLVGMTVESQSGGSPALFDQYTGYYINRCEVSISATEDAPIGVTFGGSAQTSELDATTTLATSVVPAAEKLPFVYGDGSVSIGGTSRAVTACTFRVERTVDPIRVIGSYSDYEQVPGDVVITGTLTIPYENATDSARLEGFTDAAIVLRTANVGGAVYLDWALHNAKYVSMSRPVDGRGARMQDIEFEAYYNTAQATGLTITRTAVV